MIKKQDVNNTIRELYPGIEGFSIEKNNSCLVIKPLDYVTDYEIPNLESVLSCKFYGLNNIDKLLKKKKGWFRDDYWKFHPFAKIKNTMKQREGALIDVNSVVIAPYCTIDTPGYYKDKVLDPLRKIIIGTGTFLGGGAEVMTHYYNPEDGSLEVGPVIIGERVLVGAFSKVYPGTIIKSDSVLGVRKEGKGIIKGVLSDCIYSNEKLPEPLLNERHRLYRIAKQVTKRLKKSLYNGKEVFISKSNNSARLYISPEKPVKDDYTTYSKQSLHDLIFGKEPVLACMFTDFGSSIKRSTAPQSIGKLLWCKVMGSVIGKIRTNRELKNRLYGLLGMKIGKGTRIGKDPYIEYVNSNLSSIGKNVLIGNDAIWCNHYYTNDGFITGITHISDDCEIPDGCILLPGTYIGKGATLNEKLTYQGIFL